MKKRKMITLSMFGCMALMCVSLATIGVSATEVENESKFYAVPGASVLLSDKVDGTADTNGIRFGYEMSVETYESLVADMNAETKVWADGVSVKAYIVPTAKVETADSATIIADTDTEMREISADKWKLSDSSVLEGMKVYASYAYMYNFPESAYNMKLLSCAQIIGDATLTTEVQERAMSDVAIVALDDYDYGSDNYKSCVRYLDSYTLTVNGVEYTAVKGAKLKGLPAVETANGLTGEWMLSDGTVLTENTVWDYSENKTAKAVYDATAVTSISFDKYAYAQGTAPTAQSIADDYQLGTVSAVYANNALTANMLDNDGKVNVTDVTCGDGVMVLCAGEVYYKVSTVIADRVFKQADVSAFESYIESKPDGYYVLGENLDFTGVNFQTIGGTDLAFSGMFDGKGYQMKGLYVDVSKADTYSNSSSCKGTVFGKVTGTIKNLSANFEVYDGITTAGLAGIGFVGNLSEGTLSNIYVKMKFTHTSGWTGAGCGVLVGVLSSGYVKNCVGEVDAYKGTERIASGSLALVSRSTSGTKGSIDYCYYITNGTAISYSGSGATVCRQNTNANGVPTNSVVYANATEFLAGATFAEANGWNSYWKVAETGLYFGNTLVVTK